MYTIVTKWMYEYILPNGPLVIIPKGTKVAYTDYPDRENYYSVSDLDWLKDEPEQEEYLKAYPNIIRIPEIYLEKVIRVKYERYDDKTVCDIYKVVDTNIYLARQACINRENKPSARWMELTNDGKILSLVPSGQIHILNKENEIAFIEEQVTNGEFRYVKQKMSLFSWEDKNNELSFYNPKKTIIMDAIEQKMSEVNQACDKHFMYLYERWQDEKEYEDFNDYAANMKSHMEKIEGVKFLKATKRPFGCRFTIEKTTFQYGIRVVPGNKLEIRIEEIN